MTYVAAAESLLAFWVEAGVDCMLADAAVDRIALGQTPPPRPAERPLRPAVAARPPPGTDAAAAVEAAARLATAAPDLAALAAAIEGFDGCPLKFQGASRSVFYRGAVDAPLLVIGEGPGQEEDQRGAPFVGRAGQLLDKMLDAAGLTGRVFITNSVFWRPPGNRNPTADEQAVCAPFLERAIALVRPRLLLLVGAPAAKAMLKREDGVLALRGRWFEWRSSDGDQEIPALPTLHPAFLLRQPAAKRMAWSDFLTVAERLDRPGRSPGA